MDYDSLIDAETWAFIKQTEHFYPTDTIAQSIEDQRRIYDQMCRAFFKGYPAGVVAEDSIAAKVPLRVYTKAGSRVTVIYFHGGGFVVGGLESHDDVCAEICERTGFRVVSVDYRLAPEFKHPAMFEDAMTATRHAISKFGGKVLLCGDSAGGNLAAAVSHAMRAQTDRIKGQVLIYPGLGGDMDKGSYIMHANAPMLRRDEINFYSQIRLTGRALTHDPTFAPLQDTDFSNLPPTLIVSAECDPLSDDGRDYCDAIKAADGQATWINEPGLVHGFLRARSTVARAKKSFSRIIAALTEMGQAD